MARAYATQSDYREWSGNASTIVSPSLLARASLDVDEILVGAVYTVDSDQLPTDSNIKNVLRDATCAQVEWILGSDDKTGAGTAQRITSAKLGTAAYTMEAAKPGAVTQSGRTIGSSVMTILRVEGLLPTVVRTCG